MGIHDVPAARQREIQRAIAGQVLRGAYAAVYLDGEPPPWLKAALDRRYSRTTRRVGDERVLPLTGYMSAAGMVTPYRAPQLVYVRGAVQ
jgi:hypothetical protein